VEACRDSLTFPCAAAQTTAAQPPVLDALDAVSLRTWVNAPYCSTLEGDVFKAANVLSKFTKVRGSCHRSSSLSIPAGSPPGR